MSQPENRFIQSVHKHLKPTKIHFEKTHNIYRSGTPDVYYSASPRDLWCEYKYSRLLKSIRLTSSTSPSLSPLQRRWLLERHAEGRRVIVCCGFPQGGFFIRPQEFDRLIPLAEIEDRVLPRKEVAQRLVDYLRGDIDELDTHPL